MRSVTGGRCFSEQIIVTCSELGYLETPETLDLDPNSIVHSSVSSLGSSPQSPSTLRSQAKSKLVFRISRASAIDISSPERPARRICEHPAWQLSCGHLA